MKGGKEGFTVRVILMKRVKGQKRGILRNGLKIEKKILNPFLVVGVSLERKVI